jgi:hypothetical protein
VCAGCGRRLLREGFFGGGDAEGDAADVEGAGADHFVLFQRGGRLRGVVGDGGRAVREQGGAECVGVLRDGDEAEVAVREVAAEGVVDVGERERRQSRAHGGRLSSSLG